MPFLLPFISQFIDKCIKESYFPSLWKHAVVIPLPKHYYATDLIIRVLLPFSNILEKIIEIQLKKIVSFLKNNPGFSHPTAVTPLHLFYWTKAFGMLNYKIFISLAHYLGFSEDVRKFLRFYLSGRSHQVVLNNIYSLKAYSLVFP